MDSKDCEALQSPHALTPTDGDKGTDLLKARRCKVTGDEYRKGTT